MFNRRRLLQWAAASPVFAAGLAWQDVVGAEASRPGPADALDVFDMEAAAQKLVPPAHWAYLQSGVDGDATVRANAAAYSHYQLVAKRFVDVSRIDMATTVLGTRMASPVFCSPIGGLRAIHIEGDLGVARATRTKNQVQCVSTQMSDRLEDIAEAHGAPLWFQLYTTNRIGVTRQLVQRAQRAGCTVMAITVDLPAGRNTVTATRGRREDTRTCSNCHLVDERGSQRPNTAAKTMFAGIDTTGLGLTSPSLTWDFVKQMKDITSMKVLIKGLESREDAELAVEHGADGILVSNHGGRAWESGRGTLEALPDVVKGANGRIPVLLDGGARRGTDAFKALALGAAAVGIGRPYAWGLGAWGQAGVERVLDILNAELRFAMIGAGARSIAEISRKSLVERNN